MKAIHAVTYALDYIYARSCGFLLGFRLIWWDTFWDSPWFKDRNYRLFCQCDIHVCHNPPSSPFSRLPRKSIKPSVNSCQMDTIPCLIHFADISDTCVANSWHRCVLFDGQHSVHPLSSCAVDIWWTRRLSSDHRRNGSATACRLPVCWCRALRCMISGFSEQAR